MYPQYPPWKPPNAGENPKKKKKKKKKKKTNIAGRATATVRGVPVDDRSSACVMGLRMRK